MPVVFDQSHFSEFVHEVSNARPRRAHHFGQGLVTQCGHGDIRHESGFTKARELQENPGQPFLAMVEKLIAKIFLPFGMIIACLPSEIFPRRVVTYGSGGMNVTTLLPSLPPACGTNSSLMTLDKILATSLLNILQTIARSTQAQVVCSSRIPR